MTETEIKENETEIQEKVSDIEKAIKAQAVMQKQIKEFHVHANEVLAELFKTDVNIQKEVCEEFYKAIAETGLTINEVGKHYREQLNENFQDLLKQAPKDRVLNAAERNLITATLLNIFKPIDEFIVNEQTRREGLMHVYFLNAALRSIPIRYNGCKSDWDKEDELLKEAKSKLKG